MLELLQASLRLSNLVRVLVAGFAIAATIPTHAVTTVTIDAPGCSAGGTLTWSAAARTVYCSGATIAPGSSLGVTGGDCATGNALSWNAAASTASCQPASGVSVSTSMNVLLPDCVIGRVAFNATTKTLTCTHVDQWLNVDASSSNVYDAMTDGLIIMRYLFGIRGPAMITNALSATATRTDAAAIASYLDSIRSSLDIDQNGAVDALTDGTLIIRYLFGTRGAALIRGAVGGGAFNGAAAGIETKIQSLMP